MSSKITHHMVWTADNVSSFRGFDINEAGEVELSDDEFCEYMTELYGIINVCGQTFDAGDALKELDRISFDSEKGNYERSLSDDFEEAIENEDESEIKFSQYEPWEIDEDDSEEDAEEGEE